MAKFPASLQQMVEQFNRLPGIGTKTSERFVFWLLKQPKEIMTEFMQGFSQLRDTVQVCSRCYNFSESAVCGICSDPRRDQALVCVAAEAPEVWAIEQTGEYSGLYHVLGGVVNQIEGVGPSELRIEELVRRASDGVVKEVILATNPDVEGETTAMIITQALSSVPIHITRIARGLPMGGDVEYADSVTLSNALKGRTNIK
ncbi:MAG: recombination mediator RecR [Patescibacteria group bacterium]